MIITEDGKFTAQEVTAVKGVHRFYPDGSEIKPGDKIWIVQDAQAALCGCFRTVKGAQACLRKRINSRS